MARADRRVDASSGVASVALSWVDEQGVRREGRVKVAASGLPVGWAVELLTAGATGAGMTVAADAVETAKAPQVLTRPAGDRGRRSAGIVRQDRSDRATGETR